MKRLASVLVLCLLWSTTKADEAETEEEGKNAEKFFVKSYSTTTWTYLSSLISTVPYTCYTTNGANPGTCAGRRRRNGKRLQVAMASAMGADGLTSSVGEGLQPAEEENLSKSQQDKFFFTLWKTSSTTLTVTTYATNRSVTVSASVMCTYTGNVLNFC